MKDKKKAPKLRFKGFTDDWEQCKLGDVARIVGGGTPSTKKSEYWNGNINWFTPAEIGNQIFVSHSQKKITELGLLKSSAKILPAGAILFTSRAGIGNTAILTRNACTNQGFQSIVPYSNKLDSYFIYSESAKLKRYGETMGSGSTFTEVSGKQMKKCRYIFPISTNKQKLAIC
ncbi:restriction endonuclease subunit S [Lactobacillus delbrueckii]|uniref:restriction endonuclease subunit S n=1 Tax=Lactobacillus delbrueckii TaxID=1584 RepID=UPI001E5DAE2B|nr:restriction endonuclease subunit S [Lactobacillus delbrueckii]MCD5486086.1 restriction endonuclease subunit S [Lactobacillus delbrueckii subsp. lactis]